jgi:uncharacterized protein
MGKRVLFILLGIILGAGGMWVADHWKEFKKGEIIQQVVNKEKPLEKYTIENLRKRAYPGSQIVLGESTAIKPAYTAYKFNFLTGGKKVAGLAHIPKQCSETKKCPVIVQLRGYADSKDYYTGYGTQHSAEAFAAAGFISLAPDFLGYGESDKEAENSWESRFQTYTTALDLLASVSTLPTADTTRVGIWGHSNGGQIALMVLEISGRTNPTVLWAPVSKPFPYSVLYFTDTYEDQGKWIRSSLAEFENDYDVEKYSLTNYLDGINAPLQVEQGTNDGSVPVKWSDDLVKQLKDKGKDVTYYVYPGAGHSLEPLPSWQKAVERDIDFYKDQLRMKN